MAVSLVDSRVGQKEIKVFILINVIYFDTFSTFKLVCSMDIVMFCDVCKNEFCCVVYLAREGKRLEFSTQNVYFLVLRP